MNKNPSEIMQLLYGDKTSDIVKRCYDTDPWFGQCVEDFVYEQVWRLPPLSLPEKSLVTIASLASLMREMQLQIHFMGAYNLGCSKEQIIALFDYMESKNYIANKTNIIPLVNDFFAAIPTVKKHDFDLTEKNKTLIDIACTVSQGNLQTVKACFEEILKNDFSEKETIKAVLRHLTIYTGCPSTMNGFSVLNSL